MRTIWTRGAAALLLALAVAAAALPFAAQPATAATRALITVNSLADNAANDGHCTLREAVVASNSNTASGAAAGECAAGGTDDTIVFSVVGTVALATHLPDATGSMVIDGGGLVSIDANGSSGVMITDSGSSVTFKNLTLRGGTVSYGGVMISSGLLVIDNCVVVGGNASGDGGAVAVSNGGAATIRNSWLSGGSSPFGGAVYVSASGSLLVSGSAFSGNGATEGSAIYSAGGSVAVVNSTFSGNSTSDGGVIQVGPGAPAVTLTNVTMSGNGGTNASGVLVTDATQLTIRNSIIAGNSGSGGQVNGTIDSATHNLIGVATGSLLGIFGDHGGPTPTLPLLSTASNAINVGDSATCQSSVVGSLDQRGMARPAGKCDIGAVERDMTAPTASAPKVTIRSGQSLASGAVPVRVTWSGKDDANGSGIARYVVAVSVGGASYVTKSANLTSPVYDFSAASGTTYRWRVQAVDQDGNASAWVYGPAYGETLVQQSSTSVKYSSGWTTAVDANASGGSTKYATKAGTAVSYKFIGRSVAIVALKGVDRGAFKVYVDGKFANTVDLAAVAPAEQSVVWQKAWTAVGTHTVRLVVAGTVGRPRVDLDAFVRLK
jgi:CSLREA domain-containing protein